MKKFFRIFFISIGAIVGLVFLWGIFSTLDKRNSLSRIPDDFTLLLHTDSVYDGFSPLLELKAAETLLTEPSLSPFRSVFMQMRSLLSDTHPVVKKLLSRKGDIAVYDGNNFVIVLDLSYVSAVTRVLNPVGDFVSSKFDGLEYDSNEKIFVFKSQSDSSSPILIRFEKNLAVVSSDAKLLSRTTTGGLPTEKIEEILPLLKGNKSGEIKIIADAKKAANSFLSGNASAEKFLPFVKDNSLTSISFSITNEDFDLSLNLPLDTEDENATMASLLKNKSNTPSIFSRLSDGTQYFTLVNLAPVKDLVDVVSELFPERNIPSLWKKTNGYTNSFFNISLEDLLFSWSGNEIAVLGIEGSNSPLFALQVKDEKKLREILATLDKSLLINANTSLIIGGMRLPCLELPPLLASLVAAFGVDIPRPYYLMQNGFIYFSESPQNLSAIYSRSKENALLAKNENWRNVSQSLDSNSSFSIYYDLKRSVPFFLDSSTVLSRILRLYNLGRCDLKLHEGGALLHIHTISSAEKTTRLLEGFPIKTPRILDFVLEKNGDTIFFASERKVVSLDLQSLTQYEFPVSEEYFVTVAPNGKLWAATSSGNIYLFNKELSVEKGFPIVTGNRISTKGVCIKNDFFVPSSRGVLVCVKESGEFNEMEISPDGNFRSPPVVTKDGKIVLYSRGFEGEIFTVDYSSGLVSSPMIVDGIGFGSPSTAALKQGNCIAFITQGGTFYLFDEAGNFVPNFPLELDNVFYTNAVFLNGNFFALSEDAMLYRISPDGNFLRVQLPDTVSAKEGTINATSEKGSEGIYVSGDNNILFGFDSNLELLYPFPLAGRGKPVFADVNKNGKGECITLSATREIYAWSLK